VRWEIALGVTKAFGYGRTKCDSHQMRFRIRRSTHTKNALSGCSTPGQREKTHYYRVRWAIADLGENWLWFSVVPHCVTGCRKSASRPRDTDRRDCLEVACSVKKLVANTIITDHAVATFTVNASTLVLVLAVRAVQWNGAVKNSRNEVAHWTAS
jgi:hypothetical protein